MSAAAQDQAAAPPRAKTNAQSVEQTWLHNVVTQHGCCFACFTCSTCAGPARRCADAADPRRRHPGEGPTKEMTARPKRRHLDSGPTKEMTARRGPKRRHAEDQRDDGTTKEAALDSGPTKETARRGGFRQRLQTSLQCRSGCGMLLGAGHCTASGAHQRSDGT